MKKEAVYKCFLIVVIGFIFSFLCAYYMFKTEKQAISYQVQKNVNSAGYSISKELNISTESLYALRSQIENIQKLSRSKFEYFSKNVIKRHPKITSILWAQSNQIYSQHPSLHINFSYPPIKKDIMYQVNLLENPEVASLFEISKKRQIPIMINNDWINKKLKLSDEFFLIVPVFHKQNSKPIFSGFILAKFDIHSLFMTSISPYSSDQINYTLFEISKDEKNIIFKHIVDTESLHKGIPFYSSEIYYAGEEWILQGIPLESFVSKNLSLYPFLIFIIGGILFIILGYYTYNIHMNTLRAIHALDLKSIELKELNHKFEMLSDIDYISKFYNREKFIQILEEEIEHAIKYHHPICLLMIEIDHFYHMSQSLSVFKRDQIIKEISMLISNEISLHSKSHAARFDTHQFSICIPKMDDASQLIHHLLIKSRALNLSVKSNQKNHKITISIGAISMMDLKDTTMEIMITQCENILRKVVQSGGNQSIESHIKENHQPRTEADDSHK